MEEQKKHHDWQLVAVLFFLGIGVLYALYLFFTRPSFPQENQIQPTVLNSPTPYPTTKMSLFKNEYFSLQYPNTWITNTVQQTNGQRILLKPQSLPVRESDPHISISRADKNNVSYRNNLLYYRNHGYKESRKTIGTMLAITLRGTTKTKIVNGTVIDAPLQDTYYFFESKNYSYIINTTYDGALENAENEKLFQSMLSTFTITEQ